MREADSGRKGVCSREEVLRLASRGLKTEKLETLGGQKRRRGGMTVKQPNRIRKKTQHEG